MSDGRNASLSIGFGYGSDNWPDGGLELNWFTAIHYTLEQYIN
ncbi:hypothetical protein SAMN04488067_11179 [Halorubrum xinjiangense]|uniref:Uncharacterized protein n=1 Tax=Halorubrum xinjiangense TaxID=261291 RepID=A0A1G7Q9N1_9EURY|nr:hypothetical protein SAMN04488067_11179 [Halorubrum xinjiangense]